uniref:FAD/NAD(P)-binding domain-containing protein n=1 Tax=Angiostrongylus cantonensis TaxID=6313 RepID=A0A158PB12_ANGCA
MMSQGESKRFVIIGSGPTAIGAACRLHELIEEAHLPKTTEAYMRHVINDDENIEANYVPYPVQDSIPYFSAEIKRRCLEEICSASKCSKIASNFDEFTLNTFGPTLQAIFIRPYNEKVWTVPLSDMNSVWVENRIPRTNIEDLTRRCGLSREELVDEENRKAVSMFRCTFMSNFNERLTPNAAVFWSVLVEIGMKVDEPVNEPAVLESAINDLIEHGIIYTRCIIESKWIYVLPYGYPIPTLDRDIELKKAHRKLEKENIYSRGRTVQCSKIHQNENRFGSWRYEAANQDHSFTMGTEVVDKIVFGSKENV